MFSAIQDSYLRWKSTLSKRVIQTKQVSSSAENGNSLRFAFLFCVSRAQWQGPCDPSPILVVILVLAAMEVEVAEAVAVVVDISRPGNTAY